LENFMHNLTNFYRRVALGGVALAACAAQPAMAATDSANLGVSATVSSNCNVSTSPVAFGSVDVTAGSAVNGSGSISVTCTSGTAWSAAADVGAGTGASLETRKMSNGVDVLNYALYVDNARSSIWGDGESTATIDDTGTGSAQSKTIYGTILANQAGVTAGSYADTVVVTVTY
jgi:spore coat protein U-like protein